MPVLDGALPCSPGPARAASATRPQARPAAREGMPPPARAYVTTLPAPQSPCMPARAWGAAPNPAGALPLDPTRGNSPPGPLEHLAARLARAGGSDLAGIAGRGRRRTATSWHASCDPRPATGSPHAGPRAAHGHLDTGNRACPVPVLDGALPCSPGPARAASATRPQARPAAREGMPPPARAYVTTLPAPQSPCMPARAAGRACSSYKQCLFITFDKRCTATHYTTQRAAPPDRARRHGPDTRTPHARAHRGCAQRPQGKGNKRGWGSTGEVYFSGAPTYSWGLGSPIHAHPSIDDQAPKKTGPGQSRST